MMMTRMLRTTSGYRKVPKAPNGAKSASVRPWDRAKSAASDVAAMLESVVGCKWSMRVLAAIRGGVHRPGALERTCAGISTKVLNERLRKLTRFGIVRREVFPDVPPRVEYRFTPFGREFLAIIDAVGQLQDRLDGRGRRRRARGVNAAQIARFLWRALLGGKLT